MSARELLARLERHYIQPSDLLPGGIFLPEVTMGSAGGRRCDALYVGFTSSRGHHLIGHEVKVFRADWLRELGTHEKAETWASQCHAWYVVAPSVAVVAPEELPDGWGLMVPNPRTTTRMDVKVRALMHRDRQPSWDAVHSLLKRADTLRAQAVLDARHKADAQVHERATEEAERRLAAHPAIREGGEERARRAESELQKIRDALGMTPNRDVVRSWGQTVTLAELRDGLGRYLHADRDVHRALDALRRRLDAAATQLEYHTQDVHDGRAALERALR